MTDQGLQQPPEPDPDVRVRCIELVELVTAYLEDELPPDRRASVDAHLAGCDGCIAYVDQMRQTIEVAGHLPPEAVPVDAIDPLLAAFRAARARHD